MTEEEIREVGEMALSEGWQTVARFFRAQIDQHSRRLAETDFENMLQVGRLQGEVAAYRRVLEYVARRREELSKEE